MSDVRPLEVTPARHFRADNGVLHVLDSPLLPFEVVRLFFIEAPDGAIRGQHAHVEGHQFFIVVSGSVEVRVEDPERTHHAFGLKAGDCLLVPPLHWASEHFEGDASVLLVLCDSPYTEDDYIREYSAFESRLTQSR
jgi:UDP-2-acetamido-3-amino-2,3-dideoxy-glucuronate N-acetyltransferase